MMSYARTVILTGHTVVSIGKQTEKGFSSLQHKTPRGSCLSMTNPLPRPHKTKRLGPDDFSEEQQQKMAYLMSAVDDPEVLASRQACRRCVSDPSEVDLAESLLGG